MTEKDLKKLKDEKPAGATIVAVKGDRVTYFKESKEGQKGQLLIFKSFDWFKTWHTIPSLTLYHFDFISLI